jgi:crotonobetainyl-CoA:carnitine CoA-transferase CaiB-like acyl-CoA transferase
MTVNPELPLSRFRVLDLTHARAGPTAVRHFADWGADVVMIENARGEGLSGRRDGSDFQNLHRGKRSLSLDLKREEGRKILYRLVETADVLFENFRPRVKQRLKIDFDTLHEINPRLVVVSISGFGQDGPYAERPAVDQIVQGMSGLMSVTGLPGQGPVRAGIAVSDSSAGIYAALGAVTALLEREVTGEGKWVRTSLLQSLIALSDFQAARWLSDGEIPEQAGNSHPTYAPMGLFPAADGNVNICATGEAMLARFCRAASAEWLLTDPRFENEAARTANADALMDEMATITGARSCDEWIEMLNAAGVPCGPVYRMDQVFADSQVVHLGIPQPVDHPRRGRLNLVGQPLEIGDSISAPRSAAPDYGADTETVLTELGLEPAEIADLRARRVI